MKFTIEQPQLAAIIARAGAAVEKRQTLPIVGNIMLSAANGVLTATATDLDVQVTTTTAADVQVKGSTTVSATMLQAIVGKLQKGRLVELEANGMTLHVRSGRSEISLSCLPVDDFPRIATVDFQSEFTADQSSIKRLLDLSAFAMSAEETRYMLNGVYFHSVDGKARAVATDGHRLAKIDSDVEAVFPGVIIPRKTVALLKSLLDEGSADIKVSETKIQVDVGHTVVLSKVIDAVFPDYARIIPAKHQTKVTVSAAEVKQAASLVALVSAEKLRAVKITAKDATVSLEVRSGAEVGAEDVDATIDGDDVVIGINSKYLAETLQACNGDNAVMKFNGAMEPIVIQPEDDTDAVFVVMPVRLTY